MGVSRTKVFLIACGGLLAVDTVWAGDEPLDAKEVLVRSNDYLATLNEYWPRISKGDAEAMAISYDLLNNCFNFKDEIQRAADINELEQILVEQSHNSRDFGLGVYYKCKRLVEVFDQYPGWEKLRLRAALAGNQRAQVALVRDFYMDRKNLGLPREAFPFSPAAFLTSAIEDRYPDAAYIISLGVHPWGPRKDALNVTSAAWLLVYCDFRGDCSAASSMRIYCIMMTPECQRYANFEELIRDSVSSDEEFAAAEKQAAVLLQRIRQRDWDQLGLDLVW